MASEMSITQNFRQLTLTLPADSVTVNVDVKMLISYNILLLINHYTGNTTKCHSRSMGDNRDLTGVFHQKVSSLPMVIASDSKYFQSS